MYSSNVGKTTVSSQAPLRALHLQKLADRQHLLPHSPTFHSQALSAPKPCPRLKALSVRPPSGAAVGIAMLKATIRAPAATTGDASLQPAEFGPLASQILTVCGPLSSLVRSWLEPGRKPLAAHLRRQRAPLTRGQPLHSDGQPLRANVACQQWKCFHLRSSQLSALRQPWLWLCLAISSVGARFSSRLSTDGQRHCRATTSASSNHVARAA